MRAALLLIALLATACVARDLAFPSPDGRHLAEVRNHFSIDPPKQSLWVDGEKIVDLVRTPTGAPPSPGRGTDRRSRSSYRTRG